MAKLTPNLTDWVDDRVFTFWRALRDVVPDDSWMPRMSSDEYGVAELGCGSFGCVMPTNRADTVFKLTTDESEAMFARVGIYLSDQGKDGGEWDFGEWPEGIVRYKAVYHLKGAEIDDLPVFALWRDEANAIGFLANAEREVAGILRNIRQFVKPLRQVVLVATEAGTLMGVMEMMEDYLDKRWRQVAIDNHDLLFPHATTPQRFLRDKDLLVKGALGMAFYEQGIELLSEYPVSSPIADAMAYYYDRGIVLADLHPGNIGVTIEGGRPTSVITDPGLATFLTNEYDNLEIEDLERGET